MLITATSRRASIIRVICISATVLVMLLAVAELATRLAIFTDDVHFRTARGYDELARSIASALPDDVLAGSRVMAH